MRVGIIGSGLVGESLSNGFLKHGYEVMRASRDPQKLIPWKDGAGPRAQIGTVAETAKYAELVVCAVKGSAAQEALEMASAEHLKGKTIIDATNPIADAPPQNGLISFYTDLNHSSMEQLQEAFPNANFVKAFSCVGHALMVNPDFGADKPTMFICGDDPQAKQETKKILDQFGWETADLGGATSARAIEPLCILWLIPGFLNNEWNHAFKLLKKG